VNVKDIPDELKARDRWVLWKAESPKGEGKGEKKPTKIPYSLRGRRARVNDPQTWGSFERCYARYSKDNRYDGIGFVFLCDDDIIGMDLDHCRDAASGQITPEARKIITNTNSYAEVSVSGTGVHIILKGKIPGRSRRRGGIEMYDGGRFFVMTGEHVDGTPRTVEHRQRELNALYTEVFADTEELRDHNPGREQRAKRAKTH
jgi:putative DNA primase/helicase